MNPQTDFEVTEKAGAFVAGRRSPGVGKTMLLTEDEAYYALLAGELKRPDAVERQKPRKQAAATAGDGEA